MMFTHDLQIVYVVWFSLTSPTHSLSLSLPLSIYLHPYRLVQLCMHSKPQIATVQQQLPVEGFA